MGRNRHRNDDRFRSDESRRKEGKKDKKKPKYDDVDIGKSPRREDGGHVDVPIPKSPPPASSAGSSAGAPDIANPSNSDIYKLMQQLVKNQDSMQHKLTKIDEVSTELEELSLRPVCYHTVGDPST